MSYRILHQRPENHLELEFNLAGLDGVACFEMVGSDSPAVDQRTVGRIQVDDRKTTFLRHDLEVLTAQCLGLEHQGVDPRRTADGEGAVWSQSE